MNVITYDVYKNTVKKHDGFNPVTSEKNYTKLQFRFQEGDDWEKCTLVTASFWLSNDNIVKSDVELLSDNLTATFDIPSEFSGVKGALKVGLQGTYVKDNEKVTVSTNIITLNRNTGAIITEGANAELYQKIIGLVDKYFNDDKAQIDNFISEVNVTLSNVYKDLTGKLDDAEGSVKREHIYVNAVGTDEIDSEAVNTVNIADGAITTKKLNNEVKETINSKANKATTLAEYGIKDAYTKTDTNTLLKEKTICTINNLVVQIMDGKKPFTTSAGLVMFADDDRYNYVKVNVTPGKCYAVNNSNAADAFSFFVDSNGYKIGSVADCKDTSNGYHITAPEEATILLLCGLTDSFPAAEIVVIETDRRIYGAVSVNDFPTDKPSHVCEIDKLYSHTISRQYKTIAEALSDNLLNIGDTFTTLGYYALGDGGASKYYVSGNMQTIGIKFNRIEAYAIPIYDDFLSAGAIGFLPSNPDVNLLNKALSVACCRLVKGTYTLSTNIVIPSHTVLDLNKSIINGRIVFAGALWSTLRNGYIHGGDSNAIAFSTARNGNTTVEDLEITSNTVAVIFDGADTGYNIFRNVKINAPIGIRLASGNEYAPNYIYIDKCAITGKRDSGTGIGIDVYCTSNYLWVTNCDLLGDTAIRIRKSSENFTISGNAFFGTKIGLQVDKGARIFNMRLTDNLFADQNSVGTIPIKCDGAISYSKIDNEFYNITNGYTVNDSTCSSFGSTVDAINGQLSNVIRGENIQRTNAQVFTRTYDEAGEYTFKVYAFGLPYKATPIVQANGGTVNSVTVNGVIIEVSVTMDSPGNVNIIAI